MPMLHALSFRIPLPTSEFQYPASALCFLLSGKSYGLEAVKIIGMTIGELRNSFNFLI
jgi:hypothetical protein